jgi:hypothetical protein
VHSGPEDVSSSRTEDRGTSVEGVPPACGTSAVSGNNNDAAAQAVVHFGPACGSSSHTEDCCISAAKDRPTGRTSDVRGDFGDDCADHFFECAVLQLGAADAEVLFADVVTSVGNVLHRTNAARGSIANAVEVILQIAEKVHASPSRVAEALRLEADQLRAAKRVVAVQCFCTVCDRHRDQARLLCSSRVIGQPEL